VGPQRLRISVRRGWTGLPPVILLDSRALRWRVPGTVHGAKPFHMGTDVDRLAYSLHRPGACGWQGTMVPNRRCPVPSLSSGWWPLFGGVKPPGLDI
jgi:hypothetical protein